MTQGFCRSCPMSRRISRVRLQSILEGVGMASTRMASILLSGAGFLFMAGCGAVFVNEGSKNASLAEGLANPGSNQPKKASVSKEARLISNFEDGSKSVNAKIHGGATGEWMAFSFDGNTTNTDVISSPGANGSSKAAHVYGTLVDRGNAAYPAFDLQLRFKESGYYDASAFTGIKFYYKCTNADKALKRRFAIGIAPTLPASDGGTCTDQCYNHFGADMTPTGDEWVAKTLSFNDLKRESGWGAPVTPPDLTDHLKEFVNIKWTHAANNAAGSYAIDYWADEIEFY